MFKAQRSILFQPEGILQAPSYHGISSMEEITIKTHDNVNITCWYHAPPDENSPLLVYFHGNAFHIGDEWRVNKYKSFIDKNMGVAVISYRGYGKSEGTPTEKGIYIDADSTIAYLINQKKYKEQQLILYGESLGTGVSIEMALKYRKIKNLILEAPYTSIEQKGIERYPWLPVRILIKDRFDSISKIKKIKTPTLVIHGKQDRTIPVLHGKRILDELGSQKKKGLFPEENDHTNFDPNFLADSVSQFCKIR